MDEFPQEYWTFLVFGFRLHCPNAKLQSVTFKAQSDEVSSPVQVSLHHCHLPSLVVPPSASALLILSSHSTFCRRKTSRAQSSKCCRASVSELFILPPIISRNVWYIITKIIGTWKFVLIVIIITTILKILMLIMVGFEGVEEPVLAWRSIWPHCNWRLTIDFSAVYCKVQSSYS